MKGGKCRVSFDLRTMAEGGDRPAAEELSEEEVRLEQEEGLYKVEAIRRKRIRNDVVEYLIKWRGYPEAQNTWEPLRNLQNCSNMVDSFEKCSPYEDFPLEEEQPILKEGFYALEAIRRKRTRKGVTEYLIKWRGYPEEKNTWEPLGNLQFCPDVVESFEDSLKTAKKSRKCSANGAPSGQQTRSCSPVEVTVKIEEVSEATNSSMPKQGGRTNDSSHITEVLSVVSYTSATMNNGKDALITFSVKRADGREVMVDNKFLKALHPDLLLDFYNQLL